MHSLVQDQAVENKIFYSVLYNTRFIVPIAEKVGKMMARAVNEYRLRDMKEASTAGAGTELVIALAALFDEAVEDTVPLGVPGKALS